MNVAKKGAVNHVELVELHLVVSELFNAAVLAHRALLERTPGSVPNGEEACEALRAAIDLADPEVFRPETRYTTVYVSVFGHEVPVEVEYTGIKTGDELYEIAREQLRRLL